MKTKFKSIITKYSNPDQTKVKVDAEAIKITKDLADRFYKTMLDNTINNGVKMLSGFERYLDDKDSRKIGWINHNFDRGHIVQVDLFGHFHRELTFDHPCIVLHDGGQWLLVLPVTTPRFGDRRGYTINVDTSDGFHHKSGACLDYIKCIDKRRVIFQKDDSLGGKAKVSSKLLDEIDNLIVEKYAPSVLSNVTSLIAKLEETTALLTRAEEEKSELLLEIEKLKQQSKKQSL